MSPTPPGSPRRIALPRYMQAGSGAGSPPLQPLFPPPPSPLSSESTPSAAAPTQAFSWQFGSLSAPLPLDSGMIGEGGAGSGGVPSTESPPTVAALQAELAALRAAFSRVEAMNAGLREQVRSLERGRQRVQSLRASQTGRLRDVEQELAGTKQEVGNLKDALSIVEDERDDLGRRLREVERELQRVQQRVLELRITAEGRNYERRVEREGRLVAVQDASRLREELELVRREAAAEHRRLSDRLHGLLDELNNRVPRALYECVIDRARENDRRARDGGVVEEEEPEGPQGPQGEGYLSVGQESSVGSGADEE